LLTVFWMGKARGLQLEYAAKQGGVSHYFYSDNNKKPGDKANPVVK